jgi:hypothetical protein
VYPVARDATSSCPVILFLAPTARRCDLARAHQIANVFLQEFVVVIQLIVLLLDGFYAMKYRQ